MKKRTLCFAIACAAAALFFFPPELSFSKLNLGRISAIKSKADLLKDKKAAYDAAVNHAPVISSVTMAQAIVSTGAADALNCFASDRDGDPLSYAWSVSSGYISGLGHSVNWIAPASTGAYTVSIVVSDGRGASARAAVNIGVTKANDPPAITSLLPSPSVVSTGGVSAITCSASDPDGDPLTYAWSVSSGYISGLGHTVNWIAPASSGAYTIEVTVSDGHGGSAQAAINITVLKGNLPPAIASLVSSSPIISTGTAALLTCTASDPDGDTLSYAWSHAGGTIVGFGPQVSWVAPGSSATYTPGVTVSDGHGCSAQAAINIVVTKGNTPTVINSMTANPALISTGAATAITCSASDEDGDPLSYSWSASSGTFTYYTSTGTFTSFTSTGNPAAWTAPASSGSYTVTVTVTDGHGGSAQGDANVNVYKDNNPPSIGSVVPLPAVVSIGADATLTCSASDLDGDTLTYTWSAASGTLPTPPTGNPVIWTAPNSTATYTVSVTVSDGNGGSAQASASVGVYFWKNYTTANSGIAANYVKSIARDAFGDIWFGTFESGVSKLSGLNWTTYTTGNGLASNDRPIIAVDAAGIKWIATWGGGLSKYDGTNWTTYNTSNSTLLDDSLRSIAVGPGGEKWLGSYTHGLLQFNGTSCTSYMTTDGLADNNVTSIAVDSNGAKWFGTLNGGVSRSTGTSWTTYNTGNSNLPNNMVRAIAIDPSGYKWFGTSGGVAKFDGGNWTVYTTADGLVSNTVNAIAFDGGYKWFATAGGVSRFDGYEFVNYTTANSGLADNNVLSIMISGGNKWFGTNSGGVSMKAGDE